MGAGSRGRAVGGVEAVAGYKDPLLQKLHLALSRKFEDTVEVTMRAGMLSLLGKSTEDIASELNVSATEVRASVKLLEQIGDCSDVNAALREKLEEEARFAMTVGLRRALDQSVEEIASEMNVMVADVRTAMVRLERATEAMAA
jgi:DNA-directed RNA polymerase specialized sigma24 family protein